MHVYYRRSQMKNINSEFSKVCHINHLSLMLQLRAVQMYRLI